MRLAFWKFFTSLKLYSLLLGFRSVESNILESSIYVTSLSLNTFAKKGAKKRTYRKKIVVFS